MNELGGDTRMRHKVRTHAPRARPRAARGSCADPRRDARGRRSGEIGRVRTAGESPASPSEAIGPPVVSPSLSLGTPGAPREGATSGPHEILGPECVPRGDGDPSKSPVIASPIFSPGLGAPRRPSRYRYLRGVGSLPIFRAPRSLRMMRDVFGACRGNGRLRTNLGVGVLKMETETCSDVYIERRIYLMLQCILTVDFGEICEF